MPSVADVYLSLRVSSELVKKDIEKGAKEAKTEQAGQGAAVRFRRGFQKELSKAGGGFGGLIGNITGVGDAASAANPKVSIFARVLGGLGAATGILEPAVSALAVATGALAGAAVTAGAGLAAYALALRPVMDQVHKLNLLQTQAAAGSKTAQTQLTAMLKTTPPEVVKFAKAVKGAQDAYKAWSFSLAAPVLAPLSDALKLVKPVLTALSPLVRAASIALQALVDSLGARIAAGGLKDVVATLLPHVVPTILGLGTAIGNVAGGLWSLVKAFLPFTDGMVGGIVRITQKFQDWASSLRSHSGFQAMIGQWRSTWPEMRKGLFLLLQILKNVVAALAGMATGGNSRALWIALNPVLAVTRELSSHPALIRLVLYLLALGKAGKQVSSIFTALKSGWEGVTKFLALVTGGKVQLGMQSAGDTMLVAAKQMQTAADTMVGAGAGGGAAGGAAAKAEGAAGKIGRGAGLASLAGGLASIAAPVFVASQFKLPGQAKSILASDVESFKKSFIDPIGKLWHLVMPGDQISKSADRAVQAGRALSDSFDHQRKAAEGANNALNDYTSAISKNGLNSEKTWESRDRLVKQMRSAGVQAGKANTDVDRYTDAIKKNGYGSAQARAARQNLVQDITDAWKNSERGKRDMGNYTDAVRINGARSEVARDARRHLIADLESSGLSAKESRRLVDNLTRQIGKIPTQHHTTVSVLGKGSGLLAYKQAIGREITASGHLEFHAAGGLVRGQGGPTADQNLIAASAGEYVQKAAAVARYGVKAMDAVNAGRAVIGYQAGGLIGGPRSPVSSIVPYMAGREASWMQAAEASWAKAAYAALKRAVQASGGAWPFPGGKDLSQLRRVDEGQDMQYPGTRPVNVLAILGGRRTSFGGDPGGFGNLYPGLTLDQPYKGFRQIYYGHIRPAGGGGRLSPGDVIGRTMGATSGGDAAGLSNWLEIGFWPPSWANGPAMHQLLMRGQRGGAGSARGGSWTVGGMARLWDSVGGPARLAHLMGAIGMAESGGRAWIVNSIGATGLWQIYGKPFPGDATNPTTNARMALSKYRSQGLGAWEAYTNGSYRQFMGKGGLITEPTLGIGLHSGRQIVMGERGTETVMPGQFTTAGVEARLDTLTGVVADLPVMVGAAVADALGGVSRRAAYRGAYSAR